MIYSITDLATGITEVIDTKSKAMGMARIGNTPFTDALLKATFPSIFIPKPKTHAQMEITLGALALVPLLSTFQSGRAITIFDHTITVLSSAYEADTEEDLQRIAARMLETKRPSGRISTELIEQKQAAINEVSGMKKKEAICHLMELLKKTERCSTCFTPFVRGCEHYIHERTEGGPDTTANISCVGKYALLKGSLRKAYETSIMWSTVLHTAIQTSLVEYRKQNNPNQENQND